jgi:glutathione S-transferase
MYHIPICPFSQRVEILLERKNLRGAVKFQVVDITKPRDPELLVKARGTTALPIMELEDGRIIKESLVILRYIEDRFTTPAIMQADPYARAVENMLVVFENDFTMAGYRFVMNQDKSRRDVFCSTMTAQYAKINEFLQWHAPDRDFLFDDFGFAEVVFTPILARFCFLDYYEGYEIPNELKRVRRWRDACLANPAAQQVCREEILKLYYDYALGFGNGALPPGRERSSFVFEPHWSMRPWPPQDKWAGTARDAELGLSLAADASNMLGKDINS